MLASGKDLDEQLFVKTFMTKGNTAKRRIIIKENVITFCHSSFESKEFKIKRAEDLKKILRGKTTLYLYGFRGRGTPRIMCLKNGCTLKSVQDFI